jgi:hypothetical protein
MIAYLVGTAGGALIGLGEFRDRVGSAVVGSGLGSNVHAVARSVLDRNVVVGSDE